MTEMKRLLAAPLALLTVVSPSFAAARASTKNSAAGKALSFAIPATDASCKPVFDANDKTLDTPNHIYIEQTDAQGKKTTNELITLNGERYLLMDGKWSKSRMTVAATKEQEEENKKNAKVVTCKRVGNDSVNGQAATVYTEHSETEDSKSDGKIWISASGVILKSEIDLDPGDVNKLHITTRYEYGNVKAPV